jgi:hypothetical protein
LVLRKPGETRRSIPHSLAEISVDPDSGVEAWNIDVDAIGAPAVDERRILEQSSRNQKG